MLKPKVLIITNIPAPYRVDIFYYMMQNVEDFASCVLYTNADEDNRNWSVDSRKLVNSTILKSKVIKLKTRYDNRYVHIPGNLIGALQDINPDIVIGFEYNLAAIKAYRWTKANRKSYIHLTDGTLYSERDINILQKAIRKYIISRADGYIASSTRAKEKLEAWGADTKKISVSLLTTDMSRYKNGERNVQRGKLLYVGSCAPRKGLDLLIEALSLVKSECTLTVVGNSDNAETEVLKKLAQEKNVAVKWEGYKEGDELINEYKTSELFILPTREDCFGLVLVEAMAAGIPILSSKYADGAYDVIKPGINGEIADPYDADKFASCIEKMLLNSDKYEIDLEVLSNFEIENTVKGYIEAVDRVRCLMS